MFPCNFLSYLRTQYSDNNKEHQVFKLIHLFDCQRNISELWNKQKVLILDMTVIKWNETHGGNNFYRLKIRCDNMGQFYDKVIEDGLVSLVNKKEKNPDADEDL